MLRRSRTGRAICRRAHPWRNGCALGAAERGEERQVERMGSRRARLHLQHGVVLEVGVEREGGRRRRRRSTTARAVTIAAATAAAATATAAADVTAPRRDRFRRHRRRERHGLPHYLRSVLHGVRNSARGCDEPPVADVARSQCSGGQQGLHSVVAARWRRRYEAAIPSSSAAVPLATPADL